MLVTRGRKCAGLVEAIRGGHGTSSAGGGMATPASRLGDGGEANSRPAGISPGKLTKDITLCRDAPELLGLVEQHRQSFNYMHVGAAWGTLAKMKSRKQPGGDEEVVLQQLLQRLRGATLETVQEMGAREVANVALSIANLRTGSWKNLSKLEPLCRSLWYKF